MNHDTPDGADGLFRPQLQAAMAVAGRLAEVLARQRAEQNEQMLRAEEAQRKQLQERFEAERAVMRTQLGAVHQPQFWDSAKPEDIAAQYALAQQWDSVDDMARLSREHIHDEIKTRYNLTPEQYSSMQEHRNRSEESIDERIAAAEQRLQTTRDRYNSNLGGQSQAEHDQIRRSQNQIEADLVELRAEKAAAPRERENSAGRAEHEKPQPGQAQRGHRNAEGPGDQSGNPKMDPSSNDEVLKKQREAERDHAAAELEAAAVVTGDLRNDVDTQNAAANAEELWDSGDRRAKLAGFLMERVGTIGVEREGVAAVLAADVSNGTPPSAAAKPGKRSVRRQESPQAARAQDRDFGLG